MEDPPSHPGSEADATRSQPPQVVDSDATRSQAPEVDASQARLTIDPSEVFVDEPERYVIEGRIGAGGMGVVLAAKGERLGRPVAVKVITADRQDLRRRFEREANVTARLQHPAIVPVYGTGCGRDGRPFYAMKQVSGEPLDKVLAKATTLEQRLALLPKVIAVTEAIAYAHAERVIHRDLKPANVLVGAFGETVVIDWGLAKDLTDAADEATADGPYRTQASDGTAIGKVMGTPAYMPIEQARGERVDERSDVYALGAILYHVLGGVTPFARSGEASIPWESMLARVLSASPEPLETLQPDLPKDLLAIVSRAMAKSADARYATAGELADDLKRFTTGQLVGAHQYSIWQLIRRWIRRHRTAVAVGGIAVVVLAVVGVVSVQRIVREQARTEEQRQAAVKSRNAAEDLMGFMLVDLREKLQPLGKLELLDDVAQKAVKYYESETGEASDDEQRKRALAHTSIGDVLSPRGNLVGALEQNRIALAIRERLAAKNPDHAVWQGDLADSHDRIGDLLQAQGDLNAALAQYRAALAVRERLAARPTAGGDALLGLVIGRSKLGDVLLSQGDTAAVLIEYRAAAVAARKLVALDPKNERWQNALAITHDNVGDVLLARGDTVGALGEFRASMAIREKMDPTDSQWRRNLVVSQNRVGRVLELQADLAGALAMYRSGLTILEELERRDPTNEAWQTDLQFSHMRIGDALVAHGDATGAIAAYGRSAEIMKRLTAKDPSNADWHRALAIARTSVGDVQYQQGDQGGALEHYRASLEIYKAVAARDPTNTRLRADIAISHQRIGKVLLARRQHAESLTEVRASLEIMKRLVAEDPSNADWQHGVAINHDKVGDVLHGQDDATGALEEFRRSLAIREKLASADPNNTKRQRFVAISHENIGNVLREQRRPDLTGAMAAHQQSFAIFSRLAAADPDNAELQFDVSRQHEHLGDELGATGDAVRAREHYRTALTIVKAQASRDQTNVELRDAVARLEKKAK